MTFLTYLCDTEDILLKKSSPYQNQYDNVIIQSNWDTAKSKINYISTRMPYQAGLAFMSGCGEDVKPVTRVQDCVSTFVWRPCDIFQLSLFLTNDYVCSQKHNLFLTVTERFWCLNLTRQNETRGAT